MTQAIQLSTSRWKTYFSRHHRVFEISIVLLFSLFAAYISYKNSARLHPALFEYGYQDGIWTSDLWFDSDIPKMKFMMTDRFFIGHYLTSEHPFLSFLVYLPGAFLTRVLNLPLILSIRLFTTAIAAIFPIVLYWLLRLLGFRFLDSLIFTMLGTVSSAGMFWSVVPEAFSLGAITIMIALILILSPVFSKNKVIKSILINLVSLSTSITNWAVGIFASILNLKWKQAAISILGAFGIASILWVAEKMIFPEAQYFLLKSGRVGNALFLPTMKRIIEVLRVFFAHSIVMPELKVVTLSKNASFLSVQSAPFEYHDLAGMIAVLLWAALLLIGILNTFSKARLENIYKIILISLGAQLGLHLIFGRETFLYSMHFLPFLIILSANSTTTRYRKLCLVVAVVLIALCFLNNQYQYSQAIAYVNQVGNLADKINLPR